MDVKTQTLFHLTCHVCHRTVSIIDIQTRMIDIWHCSYCSQPYYGMLELIRHELVGLMARFEIDLMKDETSNDIQQLKNRNEQHY